MKNKFGYTPSDIAQNFDIRKLLEGLSSHHRSSENCGEIEE